MKQYASSIKKPELRPKSTTEFKTPVSRESASSGSSGSADQPNIRDLELQHSRDLEVIAGIRKQLGLS